MKGLVKEGGDILSHGKAVPSALTGLTSLFGMERGEPRCHSHLKLLPLNAAVYLNIPMKNKEHKTTKQYLLGFLRPHPKAGALT